MQTRQLRTDAACYTIYINDLAPTHPFTIFLHGGPGYNCSGELQVLWPLLAPQLNLAWFDLVGCAGAPAHTPDHIGWKPQLDDVCTIIRSLDRGAVNVIGHCLGAEITHDLMRTDPALVRSVTWYSPVRSVADTFRGVIRTALSRALLDPNDLSAEHRTALDRFFSTSEEQWGKAEALLMLALAAKAPDFLSLYWSDAEKFQLWAKWMTERPFNPEVFWRLMSDYFERGGRPLPSYEGIPVLALHSDNDHITPWETHGRRILDAIPHAEERLIPNACHWLQFQAPAATAQHTLEFITSC